MRLKNLWRGALGRGDGGVGASADRTVVLLSPYFPPSTVAGVHRARHLAKYLPRTGWRPILLCVDERHHEELLDPDLAALVPSSVEIVRVGALPTRLTRLAGVGEIGLRAWLPLRRALFGLLSSRPIGAVMITGSPYYPMLLAPEIKRSFPVPVVLDFQDPWVSEWGARQPALSKAGLSHRLATALEPRALRGADFVTSVSDVQNAEMARRYPWLDASRMAGIPIGCDPDDFAALPSHRDEAGTLGLEPGFVHLSYVGTFLPRAEPLMRTLFKAVARLRAGEPALASRLRLNFIGTSNRPVGASNDLIRPIADQEGIAELVTEVPRRVPYLAALSVLARSTGLLLIGSDEPHYTASKIYPALLSGRPFLSLFHRASSAHAILAAAGGGTALSFATERELAELERPLAEALRALATDPGAFGRAASSVYAPYAAENIAARFGAILDRLSVRQPP